MPEKMEPRICCMDVSIVEPGTSLVQGRALRSSSSSRQRPRSCPERTATSTEGDDVLSLLGQRVRGGQGSILKQAFKAFDVKGGCSVTKDALYRILCNFLSGISRKQFNHLITQLRLESMNMITFDEFYSRLPGSSAHPRPRTTYLPLRGGNSVDPIVGKVMESCRKLDLYKSGKLTMEQLRIVLKEFGLPITPMQMSDMCADLGYREGQLVKYTDVLTHFTARGKSGILHSKLTDKGQRFHFNESKRACTSVGDAQTRLVTVLNSQFLKLLAAFKAQDRRGKGYVTRAVFQSVLESHTESLADVEHVTQSLCDGSEWVPYPKFLAMFEHAASIPTDPPIQSDHGHHSHTDQFVKRIRELVNTHSKDMVDAFQTIDTTNTGRLTLPMTQELLERFGVNCTLAELEALWKGLLRNKDTTVQFQEFLRQFTNRPPTGEGRHLTEDHCFMMSKSLHRDEDMVMDSVRSRLVMYSTVLLKHLSQLDSHKTGSLPTSTFMECVSKVCPHFTKDELSVLRDKYGSTIPYARLLTKPKHNPYRHGSNMSYVLSHKPPNSLADTSPPSVLTARPPYGISAIKVHLQRQLAKHWRLIRRLFREVDKHRTGYVSLTEFWAVLGECGVELSSEDKFHILEFLDPRLKGIVEYGHFISAVFEQ